MDEAAREFLVESHENLNQLDRDLVALEADPSDEETLARVFRAIHTIKGTCGFLGFSKLEALSHAGEGLLSLLRDREVLFGRDIADALLAMVDAIRRMLASIESTRTDGADTYTAIITSLRGLQNPVAREQRADSPAAPNSPAGRGVIENTIRVDVDLLNRLMTLVGELVLTRNQIVQLIASGKEPAWTSAAHRLNLVTAELQESVMKTRMQPISNLWSRLPRQVRDLSATCGKRVRLEMVGAETELDRSILEAIKDPMVHLVRNAVDHGIEPPEAREAAGKRAVGTISVHAFHEGGQVHIAIEDDGAGVDPDLIRREAVRRGIATSDQVAVMSDHEALNLIFLPGFSTARSVTNVSGRGVGMDVVKTNVERLGGGVEIGSVKGEGSRISITLPLTLAIIPALIVTCGGQRYALPQTSLLELVRLEAGAALRGIESMHGAPVYRLRGNLLPIVFLGREFGAAARSTRSARAREEDVNIVVLRTGACTFGLVVDGIEDSEEIVVKPLGRHLGKHPVFAGATILGDGRVALILDVTGLALRARVMGEEMAREPKPAEVAATTGEAQTLLILDSHEGGRIAVPLSSVARLEEFPRAAIERIGSREVVQYRSEVLPLLRIPHLSPAPAGESDPGRLQVVVYSHAGRSAGLVVDRIHDIVEECVSLTRSDDSGVLGTAIIQKRITEVLDIPSLVRHEAPEIFGTPVRVEATV